MTNVKPVKVTYPIYKMEDKGRLLLTPEVINQIFYLHGHVGETEWSGILVFDVVSGNPSKPKDFVLEAKHIYLMDIGSAAYTEYDFNEDIIEIFDNVEGSMNMKMGHIHTHHKMDTFFSGTDTDELMTNVGKHNYYLSLIVNFSGRFSAKVVFLSDIKTISWIPFVDDKGELKKIKEEKEDKVMVSVDMDILLTYENPFFYKRLPEIRKKKEDEKKALAKKTKYSKALPQYGSSYYNDLDKDSISYSKHQQNNNYDPEPDKMTNTEVEKLTKCLLSVDPTLEETRNIYQLLNMLAKPDSAGDLESFYYDYFEKNIGNVIENFFTQELSKDELAIVIREVIMSINRFKFHKTLESLIAQLTKILNGYLAFYENKNDTSIDLEKESQQIKNNV